MLNQWSDQRFKILLLIVVITGLSQGLLIPLLTTVLEQQGTSSSMNGLSAASLYVGIFLMSFFCPWVVKKLGYRTSILIGLGIVSGAIFLFPLYVNIWAWSLLRFAVGIGDSLLHYATQLWITTTAPADVRGKRISQYGFCYGLGFGIGPLGMILSNYGFTVPFIILEILLLITIFFTLRLESGVAHTETPTKKNREGQFLSIYRVGLVALCPPLLYGFLEAAIAGSFPVYGLRNGIAEEWISILISAFVWGSLLFQVPLGMLGDKWGRKRLLQTVCTIGAIGMIAIPFLGSNEWLLFFAFLMIGGLVGSLFSLGLAYLTDLLPVQLLATGNMIASVHFSLGSMLGPYTGGTLIQHFGGEVLFYTIAFYLLLFVALTFVYRPHRLAQTEPPSQKQAI
ncbi:MFS transporter [Risungbinella massiliensis]|uniref:MFS transporter n=1 Tax=Risungbinella massiliensis TaxID=1329796 RepID=UPI0005CC666F|nr:MFS transporter [Risungbinella massiliensis]